MPPASSDDGWSGSPTNTTFAPASVAALTSSSRAKVPTSEASSRITSCPTVKHHRSINASSASARLAAAIDPSRVAAVASWWRKRSLSDRRLANCRHSCSHLAVFSVSIPSSSARTSEAAAEGARPTTDPGPCSVSHAARSPAMVVDLPVPAGPTSTSTRRPDVAIFSTARA